MFIKNVMNLVKVVLEKEQKKIIIAMNAIIL